MLLIEDIVWGWQQRKILDSSKLEETARRNHKNYARFFTDLATFHSIQNNPFKLKLKTLGKENPLPQWPTSPIPSGIDYELNLGLTSKEPGILSTDWHRKAYLQSIQSESAHRIQKRYVEERYQHESHHKAMELYYTHNQREKAAERLANVERQKNRIDDANEAAFLSTQQRYLLIKELKDALIENKKFIEGQKIEPMFVAFLRREIPRNSDVQFVFQHFITAVRSEFGLSRERVVKILQKLHYTQPPNQHYADSMHEKIQHNLDKAWAKQNDLKKEIQTQHERALQDPHPMERPLLFVQADPKIIHKTQILNEYQRHNLADSSAPSGKNKVQESAPIPHPRKVG